MLGGPEEAAGAWEEEAAVSAEVVVLVAVVAVAGVAVAVLEALALVRLAAGEAGVLVGPPQEALAEALGEARPAARARAGHLRLVKTDITGTIVESLISDALKGGSPTILSNSDTPSQPLTGM